LLGVIAGAVGFALVWAGVTGRDPRGDLMDVLRGRPLRGRAPSSAGPGASAGDRTMGGATPPLRRIIAELGRDVQGWHTIRVCGVDTLVGEGTSEHVYCNAIDVGGPVNVLQQVWRWALANGRALSVHCAIYNRQIASAPDFAVRRYTGTNPHTDHVHISALPSVGGAC
jgi:hypothetical protein